MQPVPGAKAFRTTPGKSIQPVKASVQIGDVYASSQVDPKAKEVTFKLKLPAGKTQMSALFETDKGEKFVPYFAYVRKL